MNPSQVASERGIKESKSVRNFERLVPESKALTRQTRASNVTLPVNNEYIDQSQKLNAIKPGSERSMHIHEGPSYQVSS